MVSIADRLFTERKSSSEASAVSSLSAHSLLMIVDAFRAVQKHVSPMKIYLFICVFSEHRFTPAFCFFFPPWMVFVWRLHKHPLHLSHLSLCLSVVLSHESFLSLVPPPPQSLSWFTCTVFTLIFLPSPPPALKGISHFRFFTFLPVEPAGVRRGCYHTQFILLHI